jgi:hypothetical protein
MAARKKKFVARPVTVVSTLPAGAAEDHGSTLVLVHPKTGVKNEIRFERFLGKGFDSWVWAGLSQLRALAAGRSVSNETIYTYAASGLRTFFWFMDDLRQQWEPKDATRAHMEQFGDWLSGHPSLKKSSVRIAYSLLRSVMTAMALRGVMPHPKSFMPRRQFKDAHGSEKAEPLSTKERASLAAALKTDLVSLYRKPGSLSGVEALTVHALALSLRTGINTTPLLDLPRSCLSKHPLLPKMGVLTIYKGRAHTTQWIPLSGAGQTVEQVPVPVDAMALMNKLIESTLTLAAAAPTGLQDELWLYESNAPNRRGQLRKLTPGMLHNCIKGFVARHDLRGDDGRSMVLNNRRLRATLESRLWKLSNGDLITVAALMGQTPQVADRYYLAVTPEIRANAAVVSEALPGIYRTGSQPTAAPPSQPTPAGGCSDPIHGDHAPKDGTTACADFLSCLQCRSYAVVGTKEDLHRLFSFYWYLDGECQRMRSGEWKEHFAWQMSLIDVFTLDKFDPDLVEDAKETARTAPLKFWRLYSHIGGNMREAKNGH